ncbi:hypothetical protein Syun_026525 [Stephania yunnanensis]|uniref:Uncharacterized protein n=1 Tax=Stephania yunnanensis TaxID=152371 RepID=A0AAP0HX34_9MAGN
MGPTERWRTWGRVFREARDVIMLLIFDGPAVGSTLNSTTCSTVSVSLWDMVDDAFDDEYEMMGFRGFRGL